MDDLRVVAHEPHAAGSPAQYQVRDYILGQAASLGLSGDVQKSGKIENVIIRLPGTDSTGTILITGHYDSHPPAPGAGDDGISVAAMLETMRVLAAGNPLRNDVLFLFTDGEELRYLGSLAYIKEFPEAKQEIKIVLCFDARPGNAPLALRETSRGDGWLMRNFAQSRPALLATSYLKSQERGEIDTDCSQFIAAGYLGVEIENEAKGTLYHTTGDTVEAIAPNLVQAYGATMERSARHFGELDLVEAQPNQDVDYSSVPMAGIIIIPTWLTPAIAILAMLGFVALVVLGVRWKQISILRSLLGTLVFLVVAIAIALLANFVWSILLDTYPTTKEATLNYLDFANSDPWKIGIIIGAILLGIIAVYGLSHFIDVTSLSASGILAFLIVWWLAYFFIDSDNPATTIHIAWPLLGGVAGLAIVLFARRPTWIPVWLFLAAIPIFVLITPVLYFLMLGLLDGAWLPVLALSLTLGLLIPQIALIIGRLSPRAAV